MLGFVVVLTALIVLVLLHQIVTKMKIVGASQLAAVAGKGAKGYTTVRGGRVFVWPLINRYFLMDLRPQTTSVRVESAIARGIVPLNVVATVSFAVASSGGGLHNAIRRILLMTTNWGELTEIATSIIEGHLRDSIATMTPEQVMKDKDTLVQNMIRVCKADLEGIGLEITTMNIADVDDHRLDGMEDPQLYIDLLKRIQATNAETQSREARAEASAVASEEAQERRADEEVRELNNVRKQLLAETRVRVANERQRSAVGIQQASRGAEAEVAGLKAQIEAEKERIEMLRAQFDAEITTPALAEKERQILQAKTAAANIRGKAQAELDQLERTVGILMAGGESALDAYRIENFKDFLEPFAKTMTLFPAKRITVLSGANQAHEPISGIHPHPVEQQKAHLIREAFAPAAYSVGLDGAEFENTSGVSDTLGASFDEFMAQDEPPGDDASK
ncbi:MAG: SPFH domain-containing protein [bacterium]|nr:SPFH domain-containing protein [bacterium]